MDPYDTPVTTPVMPPIEGPRLEEKTPPWRLKRFWISLAVPVLALVIFAVPQLQEAESQLTDVLVWLGVTFLGGASLTRAAGLQEMPWESRRFWIGIATLILDVGVALYPPLTEIQSQLIDIIGILGALLISSISLTDFGQLMGWFQPKP
jgi:hypothetical protein